MLHEGAGWTRRRSSSVNGCHAVCCYCFAGCGECANQITGFIFAHAMPGDTGFHSREGGLIEPPKTGERGGFGQRLN